MIVGMIKVGKFIMMNVFLGEKIVVIGMVEVIFNVNWLKYGEFKFLLVYYKNGFLLELKLFEELEDLILWVEVNSDFFNYLLSIKYIELFYFNFILKKFNLIDILGLVLVYEVDLENIKNFL